MLQPVRFQVCRLPARACQVCRLAVRVPVQVLVVLPRPQVLVVLMHPAVQVLLEAFQVQPCLTRAFRFN